MGKVRGEPTCASADVDPDVWISDRGMDQAPEYIKELCRGCPMNVGCFEFAISHDVQGIWSGTTTKQRRAYRRKNKIVIPTVTDWINKELGMGNETSQGTARAYADGRAVARNAANLKQGAPNG